MGGGSLQVSLFDKDALVTTQNLKIGSLRIRERLRELEKSCNHYDQLVEEFIRNDLVGFERLYLKETGYQKCDTYGRFLLQIPFSGKNGRIILLQKKNFMTRYEQIVHKSAQVLAEDMDIDQESASLIVPTLVVLKNFMDAFHAESL